MGHVNPLSNPSLHPAGRIPAPLFPVPPAAEQDRFEHYRAWCFLFFTLFFSLLPHTVEFQWLRQPSSVSILNSGSVSPAGERICKTKHVFLLPAARGSLFPGEMGKRFPAHYVALQEFAIGYVELLLLFWGWGRGEEEEEEEESSRSEHHLHRAGEQQLQEFSGERGESKVWQ